MIIYMDKFKSIKVRKIKSPKTKKNNLFKKQIKELKPKTDKSIIIKPKKQLGKYEIPEMLSFKQEHIKPLPDIKISDIIKSEPKLNKSPVKKLKSKKVKKLTKKNPHKNKIKDKYKNKTISVKLKKNNKEKDIIQLLNSFEKMDVKDIQTKLKSKGVNTKKNNKNKLLKYIYLLTCVDDNINVIKN